MVTPAPLTRAWSAVERDPGCAHGLPILAVTGAVEVDHPRQTPYLDEVIVPDIGPQTLVLNLKCQAPECQAPEGGAIEVRPVRFKKVAGQRRYSRVVILWQGAPLRTLDVVKGH